MPKYAICQYNFLIFLLIGYMTFYCHLAALPPDSKTRVRAGVSFIDDLSRWQGGNASIHPTIYFLSQKKCFIFAKYDKNAKMKHILLHVRKKQYLCKQIANAMFQATESRIKVSRFHRLKQRSVKH